MSQVENSNPLSALVDAVRTMRGSSTSFRCGICNHQRSSDDIANRSFSHYPNCPAGVLERLERRQVSPGPRLISIDLSAGEGACPEIFAEEDQLYLAQINGSYCLGHFCQDDDGIYLEPEPEQVHPFDPSNPEWQGLWVLQER